MERRHDDRIYVSKRPAILKNKIKKIDNINVNIIIIIKRSVHILPLANRIRITTKKKSKKEEETKT